MRNDSFDDIWKSTHFQISCSFSSEYCPTSSNISLNGIILNVKGKKYFSDSDWTEVSPNSPKLSLLNWRCYPFSTHQQKPPNFPELKACGVCVTHFFPPFSPLVFLTNGTLQESRKCQHIPQPRFCFKQWHKTKRLIMFSSKHITHRRDTTHASFLVPPDRTRGPCTDALVPIPLETKFAC